MTRRSKTILAKARRLRGAERPVVMIVGNPQVGRLQYLGQLPAGVMTSEREAVIGVTHYVAKPDEATEAFHRRMCRTARDRGVGVISLGYEPPPPAPPYPSRRPDGATLN